jgi:uncharacterized protein (DUF488 family)
MVRGTSQEDNEKAGGHGGAVCQRAGGIVEASKFGDYFKVLDKLAIAMNGHAAALNRQHQVKITNALEELADKVDEALSARRENPHRRK